MMSKSMEMMFTTTLDLYRNTSGTGMSLVASGIPCSPVTQYMFYDVNVTYPNFKPLEIRECYTLASGIFHRDEVEVDGLTYTVHQSLYWPATVFSSEKFCQLVLEETVD